MTECNHNWVKDLTFKPGYIPEGWEDRLLYKDANGRVSSKIVFGLDKVREVCYDCNKVRYRKTTTTTHYFGEQPSRR